MFEVPTIYIDAVTNFWSHEMVHFALVAVISGFFYWRYRDWRLILATVLFGIFIDLDHLFDYFAHFGPTFNLANFFNVSSYMGPAGKIYVPLHGWEFIFLLAILGKILERRFEIKGLMWAIVLVYGTHLLWDHFSINHHPLAYFFTYRFLNNFSLKSFDAF